MLIRIDPESDHPIYMQVAAAIGAQIEDGALQAGDRLPSARSLSSSLGINMHTVLKAYAHLRELSKVEMRRGRGGVVVLDTPDIEKVARQLVSVARTQGLAKFEVGVLIEEAWA